MSVMRYKGYSAWLEYDDENKLFYGRVLCSGDIISFEGKTVEELETMLKSAVDHYLEHCQKESKVPAQPLKGKFDSRISPEQLAEQIIKEREEISGKEIKELLQICGHEPGEDGSEYKFWTQWHILKRWKELLDKRASSFLISIF